jgi:hypothetical protein
MKVVFSTINIFAVHMAKKSTVEISQNFVAFSEYMNFHTCLEERFESTSKPPNNIYVILILEKNAAI